MKHQHQSTPEPVDPGAIAAGHMPSEVGIRHIFVFAAVMVVISAVVMLLLRGVMHEFSVDEKKNGVTTTDLVKLRPGDFPGPRLQRNDVEDMARYRERESAALSSYGWKDQKAGIAQIPIDRAMDVLAKGGLPRPKPQPADRPEAKADPSSPKPQPADPKTPAASDKKNER